MSEYFKERIARMRREIAKSKLRRGDPKPGEPMLLEEGIEILLEMVDDLVLRVETLEQGDGTEP
jgi:hypothetical protein